MFHRGGEIKQTIQYPCSISLISESAVDRNYFPIMQGTMEMEKLFAAPLKLIVDGGDAAPGRYQKTNR